MAYSLPELAERFRRFSAFGAKEMSPFYSHLAAQIAEDKEILAVASAASESQPPANMIFAAVRLLLDRGANDGLMSAYPTRFGQGWPDSTYAQFRSFVLDNRHEIEQYLGSRNVQSNLARRAVILVLGLIESWKSFGDSKFANVEIGASAGLTLQWQKFHYKFNTAGGSVEFGRENAATRVETELRGEVDLRLFEHLPDVDRNIGVELAPVSLNDTEAVAWLRALIWPEHEDNRVLFDSSVQTAREFPPDIREGNALDVLPGVFTELPQDLPVNVYHSHTLNQFSKEDKRTLDELLSEESHRRMVNRLGLESAPEGNSMLSLTTYRDGAVSSTVELADCEAHGRWIDWR